MAGIGKGSEVRGRDELVEPIEQANKPGLGLRGAGQPLLIPRKVLVGGAAGEPPHQPVLASEVLVPK
jgi:hypothetical protein